MENTATATPPAKAPGIDPKATADPKANANGAAGAQPTPGKEPTGKEAVKNAIAEAVRKYKVSDNGVEREATEEDFLELLKEHKAKVIMEGQEHEIPYEELVKGYQARQVSAKRFEEAARIQKNAQRFIQLLRGNTAAVLAQLQIDPVEFAKSIIKKQIEFEGMNEDQKKAYELEQQYRQEKERREALERQQQEAEEAEARQYFQGEYTRKIVEGLESAGLPRTEWCVKQMAMYFAHGLRKGIRLDPARVANVVKEDLQRHMKQLYGATSEKDLLSVVGEDFASKIRKADLAKLDPGAGGAVDPSKVPPAPPAEGAEPPKKMTMAEWKERNEKILRGEL